MYCKRCYTALPGPPEKLAMMAEPWLGGQPGQIPYASKQFETCPRCGRAFDRNNTWTYRVRPFPTKWQIIWRVAVTTMFGISVAWVVAMFQAAGASGH